MNERIRAACVTVAIVAGIVVIGLTVKYAFFDRHQEPTHIEADNLRYLDPWPKTHNTGVQFHSPAAQPSVVCEADGVTWPPRADGGCYIADKPAIHDNTFSGEQMLEAWGTGATPAAQSTDGSITVRHVAQCPPFCFGGTQPSDNSVIEECVITDPHTNAAHSVDCAELVGSIAWRKQHGLYPTPIPGAPPLPSTPPCGGTIPCDRVPAAPAAYGDCWLEGSAFTCCTKGHAYRTADGKFDCDNDPYAMQGQWMADDNSGTVTGDSGPAHFFFYPPPPADGWSEELEHDDDYDNEITEGRQV